MEKTWRINKEQYSEKKKAFLLNNNFTGSDWAKYSMEPRTLDEIMLGTMVSRELEEPYLCTSYICRYSMMTDEFVRDLIYVNSGLADFGYWNDDVIDFVNKLYLSMPKDGRNTLVTDEIYEAINKKELPEEYINFLKSKIVENIENNKTHVYISENKLKQVFGNVNERIYQLLEFTHNDERLTKILKEFRKIGDLLYSVFSELNADLRSNNLTTVLKHSTQIKAYEKKYLNKFNHLIMFTDIIDEVISIEDADKVHEITRWISTYHKNISARFKRLEFLIETVEIAKFLIKDCLDWNYISQYQILMSKDFIDKYHHGLYVYYETPELIEEDSENE